MVCAKMSLRLLRCNGVGSRAIRSGLLFVKPALRKLGHQNSTAGSIHLWNKDMLTSLGLEGRATSFSVPRRCVASMVFRTYQIKTGSLGNQVKQAAWSVAYLAVGLLISWQSALLASRLADRYSWPLIDSRWHGCWDFEQCSVSWLGYAAAFLFFLDRLPPGVSWDLPKQKNSVCLALPLPHRYYSQRLPCFTWSFMPSYGNDYRLRSDQKSVSR